MSDTTSTLRRKIESAHDLRTVVRKMKSLAESNIGQYERSVLALVDYYRTVELGLGACLRVVRPVDPSSQLEPRPEQNRVGLVVFGSDQGLVGQFNEVISDSAIAALAAMPGQVEVWAIGERVYSRLIESGVSPAGCFAVPGSVQAIGSLVGEILMATEANAGGDSAAELHLFYNRPTQEPIYTPFTQRLLPIDHTWHRRLLDIPWPTARPPEVVGGNTSTLRALIREYLYISLFRACAESLASENASRLSAMQHAEQNIEDILEELGGRYHRLRQSGIDEELFDVIGGVEALGG